MHIDEPMLSFGFNQTEHPKDGLFLYGPPASNQNPARMDVGVIGTAEGIRRYETWVKAISSPIAAPETGKEENKTMLPGFQATFGIPWPVKPFATITIDGDVLSRRIHTEDRHEGIFKAVEVYSDALEKHPREQEARPQFCSWSSRRKSTATVARSQSCRAISERNQQALSAGRRPNRSSPKDLCSSRRWKRRRSTSTS